MSRLLVPLLASALLVAAMPAAAPAGDDGPTATASNHCNVGDARGYGTTYVNWIHKRNISCSGAKRLIRRFHACRQGARGRCSSPGRWHCSENRNSGVGSFDSTVRCRKGGKRVKHNYTQWT